MQKLVALFALSLVNCGHDGNFAVHDVNHANGDIIIYHGDTRGPEACGVRVPNDVVNNIADGGEVNLATLKNLYELFGNARQPTQAQERDAVDKAIDVINAGRPWAQAALDLGRDLAAYACVP